MTKKIIRYEGVNILNVIKSCKKQHDMRTRKIYLSIDIFIQHFCEFQGQGFLRLSPTAEQQSLSVLPVQTSFSDFYTAAPM